MVWEEGVSVCDGRLVTMVCLCMWGCFCVWEWEVGV